MAVPPYIAELRSYVGHRLLWIATARTVAVDEMGHVVLGRYAGTDAWTLPGGIIEPAERPADAAVRECYEETGIMAVPEALTSVTVSGIVTHDSGDLTQHLDLTFRCRAAGGQACPSDGEFEDVRWHRIDALPELEPYDLNILSQAVNNTRQAAYMFSGLTELFGLAVTEADPPPDIPKG
jgi:8-oxo-dGTP pyrophosphatase MutT (NUDIX family)